MLYFTNSFGAAIGVLTSGFVMIEALGLPGTVQAAGILNVALAAVVWALARDAQPAPRPSAAGGDAGGTPPPLPRGRAPHGAGVVHVRDRLDPDAVAGPRLLDAFLRADALGLHPRHRCGGYWLRRRIDAIADPERFLGVRARRHGLLALATLPLYGQMFGLMQVVIQALARSDSGYASSSSPATPSRSPSCSRPPSARA